MDSDKLLESNGCPSLTAQIQGLDELVTSTLPRDQAIQLSHRTLAVMNLSLIPLPSRREILASELKLGST
jgi:hypothetical protein